MRAAWVSLVGALVGGGLFFLAGFFGPIWLWPSSNQGPLTGIFITGPAGFLLGGILGMVIGVLRSTPRKGWFGGLALGITFSTVCFSLTGNAFSVILFLAGIVVFGLVGFVSGALSVPRRNRPATWVVTLAVVLIGLCGFFLLGVMLAQAFFG